MDINDSKPEYNANDSLNTKIQANHDDILLEILPTVVDTAKLRS